MKKFVYTILIFTACHAYFHQEIILDKGDPDGDAELVEIGKTEHFDGKDIVDLF